MASMLRGSWSCRWAHRLVLGQKGCMFSTMYAEVTRNLLMAPEVTLPRCNMWMEDCRCGFCAQSLMFVEHEVSHRAVKKYLENIYTAMYCRLPTFHDFMHTSKYDICGLLPNTEQAAVENRLKTPDVAWFFTWLSRRKYMHKLALTHSKGAASTLVHMPVSQRKGVHVVISQDRGCPPLNLQTVKRGPPHHDGKWYQCKILISYARMEREQCTPNCFGGI